LASALFKIQTTRKNDCPICGDEWNKAYKILDRFFGPINIMHPEAQFIQSTVFNLDGQGIYDWHTTGSWKKTFNYRFKASSSGTHGFTHVHLKWYFVVDRKDLVTKPWRSF